MDYVWLIITIVCAAACPLLFKAGMLRVGQSPQNLGKLPRFLLKAISNPYIICGIVFFVVMALTLNAAISVLPLSFVNPLTTAIPLVLIMVFSSLWFKEKVNRMSWLGIATICVGVTIFGVGAS